MRFVAVAQKTYFHKELLRWVCWLYAKSWSELAGRLGGERVGPTICKQRTPENAGDRVSTPWTLHVHFILVFSMFRVLSQDGKTQQLSDDF